MTKQKIESEFSINRERERELYISTVLLMNSGPHIDEDFGNAPGMCENP